MAKANKRWLIVHRAAPVLKENSGEGIIGSLGVHALSVAVQIIGLEVALIANTKAISPTRQKTRGTKWRWLVVQVLFLLMNYLRGFLIYLNGIQTRGPLLI
jgi:hypothetical protein